MEELEQMPNVEFMHWIALANLDSQKAELESRRAKAHGR